MATGVRYQEVNPAGDSHWGSGFLKAHFRSAAGGSGGISPTGATA
ncbi:hypothetical protein Pla52o_30580 [Novipirellula galeiformis]|uniref:Uncharacterized protein n=1 Tax=Novipirellula galeiformis TaxID=2528004 RepID=A0A5C6CBK3_9BACT|nr:hypothetical protein Pla52o_30580 [Novipirellula galeiformis]